MRDRNKLKSILVSILFFCISALVFAQDNNELKQTAENKFEEGDYKEAMALYSQLTSFYPKDAFYNYRLGACMVIVESDKNKALKYLEYAVSAPDVNNEANYYMGLAYHYNYRFKEAKVYYNKFKTNANRRQLKDFEVERQLRMCNNGEDLLSNISDLEVLESKKVDRENFQLSYRLSGKMGSILKVPAELLTNQDEKEELKTLMHRTSGDYVYYASYGENDETGLDLYRARLENGELGTPQRLPSALNTPFDEEFPYMDPSGTKFYFASKGHTSMGGYDIFVADYDSTTDQWSTPRNLDFAVNTPDDDILYVVDENGENAFFSSTRNIVKGNIHFYQIKAGKQPIQFNLLIGQFDASSGNVATITVENRSDGTKVGSYTTQRETGKYTMRLPNGGKFKFIVEVAGSDKIHTGMVETPFLTEFRPLKQEMNVLEENGTERLIIKNIFDQPLNDEDRLLMAQELVQKSKLSADDQVEKSFDREELTSTIQKESKAAKKSATAFNKQAANLYQLASAQTKLANDELILAEEIASSVQDFDKPSAQDEAKISEINQLRKEAKKHSSEAHLAIMMAQILETKLAKKGAEADELSALLNQAEDLQGEQLAMKFNNIARSPSSNNPLKDAYSDLISGNSPDAKKANRLMLEADKLREEKRIIEEDMSYYRQQASQTRDRKLRKSFEDNVENLETELKALNTKLDAKYNQAEALDAGKSLSAEEQAIAEELVVKQGNSQLSNLTVSDLDTEAIAKAAQKIRDKARGLKEVTPSDVLAASTSEQVSGDNENEAIAANPVNNAEAPQQNTSESFQEEAVATDVSAPKQITDAPRENVLDTPAEFKNALAQAAKIENKYDREYEKREINQKWLSNINKDIAYLRNELEYNPNTPNKADKRKKLTNLESQAENKRLDIMMSERIMSETAPESNKEILENALAFQAVQDIEDRFFFDYESLYDINNEQERLQAENEINTQYIQALTNHLNQANAFQEGEEAAVNQLVVAKKQRIQENNKLINEKQATGEEFVYQGDLSFEEPVQEEPIENDPAGTAMDNNSARTNQNIDQSNASNANNSDAQEQGQEVISVMPVELTQEAQLTNKIDSLNRAIRLKNEDLILANRRKDKKQIEADIINLETEKNALETQLANLPGEDQSTETWAQNEAASENQTLTDQELGNGVENQEINPDFIEANPNDTAFEIGSSESFVAQEVNEPATTEEVFNNAQAENTESESSVSTEQVVNIPDNTRSNQSRKLSEAAKLKKQTEEIQDEIDFNQSAIRALEIQIDNTSKRKEREPLATELAQLQAKQEDLRSKAKLFYYQAKVAEVVGTRNQQGAADLSSELNQELEQSTSEVNSLDLSIRKLKDEISGTIFKKNRLPLENELIIKKSRLVNEQSIIPEFQGFLDQLEPLLPSAEPLAEETSTNQSAGNFNEENSQPAVDQEEFLYKVPKRVERDIFSQDESTSSAYSIQNPIPIVNKLPQGLVYKVQIGAFRNPIPQETFKGFSPITGEKTSSGFIRYTAGYFKGFDKASVARNEIKDLGYRDAFVVAYFNGERIPLSQAKSMTSDQAVAATNNARQGIEFNDQSGSNSDNNIAIQRASRGQIDVKPVGERGELFYTVQIGVFGESIDPNSTFEISPVNADRTGNGMIRYSSGVFNSVQAASSAKTEIQEDGIPDAFVTAYFKGKRISISEAKKLMEQRGAPAMAVNTNPANNGNSAPDLSDVPAKTNVPEGEIAYKVEIGPYQGEVPVSETEVILKYNKFGISLRKENSSTRYQVGEYVTFDDAQKLQNSLLNAGISTAKVIKLRNGEIIE